LKFSDTVLTIDTREQNRLRIQSVREYFEEHGAVVVREKLDLCDYRVEGTYRGVEMDLGVEAKSLPDFMGSIQDLPHKLLRSYDLYRDVGLFLEASSLDLSVEEGKPVMILHPARDRGVESTIPLSALENALYSWNLAGVHVRRLYSEKQFPFSLESVMDWIAKPIHDGLYQRGRAGDYTLQYMNTLVKIPGVGGKTARKILRNWVNWRQLVEAQRRELEEVLGKARGRRLYEFLRSCPGVRQETIKEE
jgi:ERCC4-type nuclease